MTVSDVLEMSVLIAAPPETVFPYFTDPARYVQWMGSVADLEPVPGGTYRVRMKVGMETVGEFLEVEPPSPPGDRWCRDALDSARRLRLVTLSRARCRPRRRGPTLVPAPAGSGASPSNAKAGRSVMSAR